MESSSLTWHTAWDVRDVRDLARDSARLAPSLEELAPYPAYGLDQLRDDLERFAFLPGGSDGESLFGPPRLT
jgi:hypothetical protein